MSLLVSKYPIDKTKTLKLLLAKLHEKMKHESRPHSLPTDYEEIVKEEIYRLANDNQELWDKDDPTQSDGEDGKMFFREQHFYVDDKKEQKKAQKKRRERRYTKKMRRTKLFHFKVLEL